MAGGRKSGIERRDVVAGLAGLACAGLAGPSLANTGVILKHPGMLLRAPPRGGEPRSSPYPDLIGRIYYYVAKHEDTLVDLARDHGLGYTEIISANKGLDPWLPGAGARVLLPTAHLLPDVERMGIVLNLADQRLYYFEPGTGKVHSYPIGVGSEGWLTPTGRARVVRKKTDPTWYVPKSIRAQQPELPAAVAPGPDNPLGAFALYLSWRSYLIHGTNKPSGVGRRVSHGCIRLYPENIEQLFAMVEPGTPVAVVDQPVKLGWVGEDLVLEIHPTQSQADEIEATREVTPVQIPELSYRVMQAAGNQADRLDWPAIGRAMRERTGVPIRIFKPRPVAAAPSRGG